MNNQMNDFLVAETYSYALFNGIFFTRWVEEVGRDNSVDNGIFIHAIVPRHIETVCLLSRETDPHNIS